MEHSILDSTKKVLGVDPDFDEFDQDILTHINSALSILTQLGIGPPQGYFIDSGDPEWRDFIDDYRLNTIRSYVYLKVRLLFDPPTTSYLLAAQERQISEMEWRMNIVREGDEWVDPDPVHPEDNDEW